MSKQSSEEAIEIAGFKKKKAEEPEIKLPTSTGSYKKQKNSRKKKIYSCFLDYTKAFDCGITSYGKFIKRWENQTTLPAPEKPICRSFLGLQNHCR